MNEFFWHQDSAFMALVEKPLTALGIVFAAMLIITIVLVIRSKGGSDDA